MSEIILLDNENVTLRYLEDEQVIYHTVHQPISGQPYREFLEMGLDALQEYGVTKWVSDDRKNGPMTDEDREWGDINLTGRAMETGWKYWALVVPEALVAAGSMQATMAALHEQGLRMMVFDNVDDAFNWIEQFDD